MNTSPREGRLKGDGISGRRPSPVKRKRLKLGRQFGSLFKKRPGIPYPSKSSRSLAPKRVSLSPSVFWTQIVMELTKNGLKSVLYEKGNIEIISGFDFWMIGTIVDLHYQGKVFLRRRRDIERSGADISSPLNGQIEYRLLFGVSCQSHLPSAFGFCSSQPVWRQLSLCSWFGIITKIVMLCQ